MKKLFLILVVFFSVANAQIQLSQFSVRQLSPILKLQWVTLGEVNNRGFNIQIARDTSGFITTGAEFVPGHGTTNLPHFYSAFVNEAATNGRWFCRLKQTDLSGTVRFSYWIIAQYPTSAGEDAPLAFRLEQNYPNPFNPTTTIQFSISQPMFVSLKVYNLIGEEVATLVNGERDADEYSVVFDASEMPSGVYVYRLQSARTEYRKMMLVR